MVRAKQKHGSTYHPLSYTSQPLIYTSKINGKNPTLETNEKAPTHDTQLCYRNTPGKHTSTPALKENPEIRKNLTPDTQPSHCKRNK